MLGIPHTTNLNWACSSLMQIIGYEPSIKLYYYVAFNDLQHIHKIEHNTILAYCVRDVITTNASELHSKMEGSLEYLITRTFPFFL